MKLLFKQRLFSWLDSYDIFDQNGNVMFNVQGKLSFGHCLHIHNNQGEHIATLKQEVLTFFPKFSLYYYDEYVGEIKKELSFLTQKYDINFKGWHVEGNFTGWEYDIYDAMGNCIARVDKELWNFTDTYSMNIARDEDAIYVLMLVLAIDVEKCSNK